MSVLDKKINDMLDQIGRAAPAPPAFDELRPGIPARDRRLIPLAAATVLLVAGVVGMILVSDDGPDPVDRLPAVEPDVQAAAVGGQLLSTPIERSDIPYIAIPGATVTYAFSDESPGFDSGFERIGAFVGAGPTYDAALLAAFVVDDGPSVESDAETEGRTPATEILESMFDRVGDDVGEGTSVVEVDVAGRRGAAEVRQMDVESQLAGPIVTLYAPLDDGTMLLVNATRLTVDEVAAIASSVVTGADGTTLATPGGYTALDPAPSYPETTYVEYQYDFEGRRVQVNASNRGTEGLLGRMMTEVRTNRVVAGHDVAYRPLPDSPGRYWADWVVGDWSFYASVDGFDSEEQFLGVLSQLTLTDAATLDAQSADGVSIVVGDERSAIVDDLLVGVPLPPGLDAATLAIAPGANERYQEIARVSGAVACGWLDEYFDAQDSGDAARSQVAADALATAPEWDMLVEIDSQGGWSGVLWETAAAVNGEGGVVTGAGPQEPTRENTGPGLGCTFD